MDDLFDAFDAAPAAILAGLPIVAPAKAQAASGSTSSATASTGPSDAQRAVAAMAATSLPAVATRKRQREEEGESSSSSSAAQAPAAVTSSSASSSENVAASAPAPSARAAGGKTQDLGEALDAAAVLDIDPRRNESLVEFEVKAPEDSAPAAGAGSSSGGAGASGSDVIVARPHYGVVDENKTTAPEPGAPPADFKPAKTYPFKLDPFQQRAVECLERNESVLVSAHTSAGKTVVAEYAIAMSLRDKQRVIYTSPIKALSNQKYRDLFEEFSDVGLMTGDVTINPNASCLVMTTEILRSMLYRGSEVMREVKWVIFDEIHYMRDRDRGVVWEESIILMPHAARFVFLSATIPNSKEFAEWVAKIHHQTCHVVYTDYRPTPLQHFIFPGGGEGVYLVVDEKGRFREDNFNKAMSSLGTSALEDAVDDVVSKGGGKKKAARKQGGGKGGPTDLSRIIKMIMERRYDPVIVFSFSKRECETYALALAKMDFTSGEEKALIEQVFVNAIDSLSEDDKKLPQIDAILPLLKRGVGIHHGGLLPILKEVIEILFQESLLKILFATETFSMGINMPARTVVFTASRKFDGTDFRWISPGEYIQMSGRAGRRGLDDRGIVIQMIDEKMEPATAKTILKGSADPLNSAFHLGYNMLLNLLRVEDADPERMMALSFHQFQSERQAPAMEEELGRVTASAAQLAIADEPAVAEYYQLVAAMEHARGAMRAVITRPEHALPFLQPGRLVRVVDNTVPTAPNGSGGGEDDWGWGVVVNFQKRPAGSNAAASALGGAGEEAAAAAGSDGAGASSSSGAGRSVYVLDVLLACAPDEPSEGKGASSSSADGSKRRQRPRPWVPGSKGGELRVVPVQLPLVSALSSIRVYIPKDLRPSDAREGMWERLREVQRRFPSGLPLLDPVEDMQITGDEFRGLVAKSLALQTRIAASPLQDAPDRDARFETYKQKLELEEQARFLRGRIDKATALVMKDTLRKMKRVLRRLGLVTADNVVTLKGRVACEVNTADELLVTELIFTGAFNDLDAGQAAALLSCLVFEEKGDEDAKPLREELAGPLRQLQEAARRVAQVSQDCKIELDAEEYVSSFRPEMMELVYAWTNGAKFVDIAAMTKQFEGSIIRVIRRLEELCRQLADAAKSIGDEALEKRMREASTAMRRDIVFAASLYL